MSFSSHIICLFLILSVCSCSNVTYKREIEEYKPVTRRYAPEPVYSRVTWAHLPQPIAPKTRHKAPFLMPTVSFELRNSNLKEAVEALSQTMGYDWYYPKVLASRRVSIKMQGTLKEVLDEIARQAKVQASFDHKRKLVRVFEERMLPRLPGSKR